MRSPLRYPGGKSKVRKKILAHFPHYFSEYREPFVGGGGIFFALNPTGRRWINDVHPGLMAVYQALHDRPIEFIKMCRDVSPQKNGELKNPTKETGKKYNARLGKVFENVKLNEACDQAFRYFFVNRTVWMGRVNYDLPSRLYYSNPEGWDIVKTDRLEQAAAHLTGVVITCEDYSSLLDAPGDDVMIYCDPPYVVNTEMTNQDKQYQHNFTLEDHETFVEAIKACPHKVCISYDDCDSVRDWFADSNFTVHEEEWKYSGSVLTKKKTGQELILTNYDIHA